MRAIAASAFVEPSAFVEDDVSIGEGARIWHHAHVRAGASIGARCIVGKGAFVDVGVRIGDDSKIQNYACIYHGATLGRGVFVGPHAIVTNDRRPRATTSDFRPLRDGDWTVGATVIDDGASIGANATVVAGVSIGRWAMVGAGAVVTRDVAAHALVIGSPARRIAWVCACGERIAGTRTNGDECERPAPFCARCGP